MMDDWSVLSDSFAKQEFLGPEGFFFVLAPYQDASGVIRLSAVVGKHEALDPQLVPNIEQAIQNEFGILNEAITQFIPFSCLAAGGHFSSPMSEAFILPELWMIPNSVAGPSLSNTTQHRRRLNGKIGRYLPQIFEPQTSELLIDALADETIGSQRQTIEYLYHEAGHASGLGIKRKVRENLFHDVWDGGVEEWRTDGIEFELMKHTLPAAERGRMVAVNLCLRFGIDAQRALADEFEEHSICSLLMLDGLLKSGLFGVKNNQLALLEPSYDALSKAVDVQRAEAVRITHTEIAEDSIACYRSVEVDPQTRAIFQKYVLDASV
jgi:hypothetical protein